VVAALERHLGLSKEERDEIRTLLSHYGAATIEIRHCDRECIVWRGLAHALQLQRDIDKLLRLLLGLLPL
jgi:hypothetical protein